ncbi:hypothetical protein KIN20_013041 [Parelaphostrongylus tenuis]|uniref:Uncharacterized protein n=1 Tax=Parelaphostrongylus tenuis TaxID=148309 RepID=A0AAD5MEZ5_PARTN|nr:hypothetical protein KIN20_013041 [Parelaphostrongylus tenuis]
MVNRLTSVNDISELIARLIPETPFAPFDNVPIPFEPVIRNGPGELLEELRPSLPVGSIGRAPISLESLLDRGSGDLVADLGIPQIEIKMFRAFEDVIDHACVYGEYALKCLRESST